MLQRDYILRLIREFFAALARMLEKKEVEDRREAIKQMYEQFVGPYSLFHDATTAEVMDKLSEIDEEHRMAKIEMLAELYYAEADTVGQPERDFLLGKAFDLFEYIDRHGKTYSFDRMQKMSRIRSLLGQ